MFVRSRPAPQVTIQPDRNPICAGQQAVFTSNVNFGGPTPRYQWQVNGVPQTGDTLSNFIADSLNNADEVRVAVISTDGCPPSGSLSNRVQMQVFDQPQVSLAASQPGICNGDSITFEATPIGATGNVRYTWVLLRPGLVRDTLPIIGNRYITDTLRPEDTVRVQITNANGCTDAAISSDTLHIPVTTRPDLSVLINDSIQCLKENEFAFVFDGDTIVESINWTFGPGSSPSTSTGDTTDTIRWAFAGTHQVKLEVTTSGSSCIYADSFNVQVLPSPDATFNTDSILCIQGIDYDFQFVGDTAGIPADFLWDFGPGAIAPFPIYTLPNPQNIEYVTTGTKTVTLYLTLDNGCADTSSRDILVGDSIQPTLGPDITACLDDPSPVLRTNIAGAQLTEWYRNGQRVGGNTDTLVADSTGQYLVRVTMPSGCVGTDVIFVSITPTIEVDLGDDIYTCPLDTPIVLRSGYPNAGHVWIQDGSVVQTGVSDSLLVFESGVYTVEVTPAGSNCSNSDVIVVTLSDEDRSGYLGDDITYCLADTAFFLPLDGGAVPGGTYIWYRDGRQLTSTGRFFTPNASGEYISLVTTQNGCFFTDTINVEIRPTIEFSLGPDTAVCPADPLFELPAPLVPGALYELTFNGNVVNTEQPPYLVTEPGTYRLTIISQGGCQHTDVLRLNFRDQPFAAFEGEPPFIPEMKLAASNPIARFINNSTNAQRFRWEFGDGDTSALRDPTHTYPPAGNYRVRLLAFSGPCSDSTEFRTVQIRNIEDVFIPNAFSPSDNDPRNQVFNFYTLAFDVFEFQIFDRWGNQVYFKPLSSAPVDWNGRIENNGAECPEGVYIYRFRGLKFTGEEVTEAGQITLIR